MKTLVLNTVGNYRTFKFNGETYNAYKDPELSTMVIKPGNVEGIVEKTEVVNLTSELLDVLHEMKKSNKYGYLKDNWDFTTSSDIHYMMCKNHEVALFPLYGVYFIKVNDNEVYFGNQVEMSDYIAYHFHDEFDPYASPVEPKEVLSYVTCMSCANAHRRNMEVGFSCITGDVETMYRPISAMNRDPWITVKIYGVSKTEAITTVSGNLNYAMIDLTDNSGRVVESAEDLIKDLTPGIVVEFYSYFKFYDEIHDFLKSDKTEIEIKAEQSDSLIKLTK